MNRKISIQIQDATGKSWQFENLKSLKSFLSHEDEFWTKKREGISNPHLYFNQQNSLINILNTINTWADQIDNWDDSTFSNELSNLQRNYLNNLPSQWLWSGHTFVSTWIDACRISAEVGAGFLEYIKTKQIAHLQNQQYFKGYLLAYEFEMQDETTITKRRNAEKVSFSQLRTRLDNTTNSLIQEVDEFKNDFNEWNKNIKKDFDDESAEHHKAFNDNQMQRNAVFEEYMSDCKNKISELENTYHEKLRLEKPAQYWKNKAFEYKINGNKWAIGLGVVLGIGMLVFAIAFYLWLQGESIGIEVNSLQGAVIFATLITIYALTVQSLSKMVFSSYHLQRDAEEREQLAYVYLALTNEQGEIDVESRKIVLQSLFSRADTGLLKDSSPTMPGIMGLMKQSNN